MDNSKVNPTILLIEDKLNQLPEEIDPSIETLWQIAVYCHQKNEYTPVETDPKDTSLDLLQFSEGLKISLRDIMKFQSQISRAIQVSKQNKEIINRIEKGFRHK